MTPGGQAVLKLRLATNESYLDRNNVRQERTEWHRVTIWGRRAEALGKFLQKGDSLFIEGRLQTSSYEKNGEKRYSTEVVANNIVLPAAAVAARAPERRAEEAAARRPSRSAPGRRRAAAGGGGSDEAPFDDFEPGRRWRAASRRSGRRRHPVLSRRTHPCSGAVAAPLRDRGGRHYVARPAMQEGIHPDYPAARVTCACGNTFVTRSTRGDFQVDVCGACHPFYTGTQKLIDTAGRVDRFRKRYEKKVVPAAKAPEAKPEASSCGIADAPAARAAK